jgi:macrolide phosphotransferase
VEVLTTQLRRLDDAVHTDHEPDDYHRTSLAPVGFGVTTPPPALVVDDDDDELPQVAPVTGTPPGDEDTQAIPSGYPSEPSRPVGPEDNEDAAPEDVSPEPDGSEQDRPEPDRQEQDRPEQDRPEQDGSGEQRAAPG